MISLQFVRGNDFGARAIEWFSHGADFSHVDTIMPDGRLLGARSDVIGGAPPGVQLRNPGYIGGSVVLRVNLTMLTDEETNHYHDFLMAQIGKPYDIEGIVSFITGRQWDEPSSWFCSELVAAGLRDCGYFPYPLAAPSNKVTPPDLLQMLSVLELIEIPT